MLFSKKFLAAMGLASFTNAEIIQIIATSDDYFEPAVVLAALGDILEFHLEHTNHSAVAGDYLSPCTPMVNSPCFDSGETSEPFRYTVDTTDPIPFYSSHGDECSRGMVGIINPSDDYTFEDYKKRATMLSKRQTARADLPDLEAEQYIEIAKLLSQGIDIKDIQIIDGQVLWTNESCAYVMGCGYLGAAGSTRVPLIALWTVVGAALFIM